MSKAQGVQFLDLSHLGRKFLAIPDVEIERYIDKAIEHLQGSRRSWSEDNNEKILYITAVYLYQLDQLCSAKPVYPYYVVHSQNQDWRFETSNARTAFNQFKQAVRGGDRVGLFHWASRSECKKLYGSEGYAFERDFGAGT